MRVHATESQRATERGWWGRSRPSWLCITLPSHHHFQSASSATFSTSPTTPDSPQAYFFLQIPRKTLQRLRFIPPDGPVSLTKRNKSPSKYNGRFKHIIAPNGENQRVERPLKKIASCHRKRERERKKLEHVNSPGWWERGCGLTERVRSHSAGCLLLWMDVDQWKDCIRPLCEDERDGGGWEEPKTGEPR